MEVVRWKQWQYEGNSILLRNVSDQYQGYLQWEVANCHYLTRNDLVKAFRHQCFAKS